MELNNEAISKELSKQITDALKKRFKEQGHDLNGKGLNSLETVVKSDLNGLVIQILGEHYMGFQDSGRRPGSMPPIEPLMKWVMARGIASDMKSAKRIAFGIAINMKKIGMHSTNKRIDLSKRHFIKDTIEDKSNFIQESLFKMFSINFDLMVTNYTKQLTEKLIVKI